MRLSWTADARGFHFTSDPSASPDAWAAGSLLLQDGTPAHVGPLLALLEDGAAEASDGGIRVSHDLVAAMPRMARARLGLPRAAPFRVRIHKTKYSIDEPEFHLRFSLVDTKASAVRAERTGALLEVAGERYVLSSPLFEVLEAIDEFNRGGGSLDEKFRSWAGLRTILPEDAVVEDDQLRGIQIAMPIAFTLRPYVNERGEPDFEPELLQEVEAESETLSSPRAVGALPAARQRAFERYFRRGRRVKSRYAAEQGWYVVLDEPLRRSLEVVKRFQAASPAERRLFIENPHVHLREALGEGAGDEPSEEIDLVFHSDGYGDRVIGVGLRQARVLPWVKLGKEPWLPPEALGVRIGDDVVEVPPAELRRLREDVAKARAEGRPSVTFGEHTIPATSETLEVLTQLIHEVRPKEKASEEPEASPEKTKAEDQVLLVKENLEFVEYEPKPLKRNGDVGGLPSCLETKLLPHQLQALSWLQRRWVSGAPGALLADDMGLGKTFVALSFLAWAKDAVPDAGPLLIVAPTGLLKNWIDEHDKHLSSPGVGVIRRAFGKGLRDLRLEGAAMGKEVRSGLPALDVRMLEQSDAVLTTFETLRDYQHSFGRVRWSAASFDEVQKIKNPAAGVSEAAKAMNIDFTLALTGTPVENRLSDLWSIVDTIHPSFLGTLKEFSKIHERSSGADPEVHQRLKERIFVEPSPPLALRRMKEDHLEGLPEKKVHVVKRSMPGTQAGAYEAVVEAARAGSRTKGAMLEALHRLRSVSLHPHVRGEESDEEYRAGSARLDATIEILDEIRQRGERALIFVESRDMQGVLLEMLQRRYSMRHPPLLINGTVSGEKRKARVDEFQTRDGFDVMILSPKAGGVGLTLTAANHVIHLSRWWNPAVEDQCNDRIYRIGQAKTANIYLPMAVHPRYGDHSFDVRLDALLSRKRTMSRTVLAPVAVSEREARSLFNEAVEERDEDPG